MRQRKGGSATAGLVTERRSRDSFGFPAALWWPPTPASTPGWTLKAEHAGVGVKPAKDASPDATDGMVWGVRREAGSR